MAELALKINNGGTYEDGDILCAFNRRRIRCDHAQRICFPKSKGPQRNWIRLNGVGLLNNDDVARDYEEATKEYRLDRLAISRCRSTRLSDRVVIEWESNRRFIYHDGRECQMDIAMYFRNKCRTLRSPGGRGQPVFGKPRREIIYDGRTTVTHATLDNVWNAIEAKTAERESDHTLWGAGSQELKSFFFVSVDDFDEAEAGDLVAPLTKVVPVSEENPEGIETVEQRKHKVSWEELPGISADTIAKIRDGAVTVDGRRKSTFARRDIILLKPQSL